MNTDNAAWNHMTAAIQGARDIAVPLSFSILTNIVAFIPLAMVPGWIRQVLVGDPGGRVAGL